MATFVKCTGGRDAIYINLDLITQMHRINIDTDTKITFANGGRCNGAGKARRPNSSLVASVLGCQRERFYMLAHVISDFLCLLSGSSIDKFES